MNKLIIICSILLFILPSSAQLETHIGFPVNTGYTLQAKLVTADLDGDGKLEIIAAPENRKVMVFNTTGRLVWENVGGIVLSDTARIPVARNISGDNLPEILTYGNPGMSDSTFYIWDAFGSNITEMMVGNALLLTSPSVTKDGIILTAAAQGRASVIINGTGVHAFDHAGNRLWYLELGMNASIYASIPLADLDDDGQEEAVILTQDVNGIGKVWAIKVNRIQGTVLWNRLLGGDARKVAVGDLNKDGRNEVVVLSTGGVYIFDGNGTELNRFDLNTNLSATPAIGDLEGDGINEVVIASHSDKKIYLISNGSVRNFSSTGRVGSNVALGDINADGKLEIFAGEIDGYMYIWYINGTEIEKKRDTTETFSSALISDLDRDGNKELILGNSNGNIYVYTYRIMESDTFFPITSDDVNGSWHNSSVTVTLSANDVGSGIAYTYYTIDGSTPTTDSPKGNIIIINSNGVYNISYFSVDYAGNVEDVKTASNQVKIDTMQPSTSDDADNLWHNTAVTFNLTAFDNLSGVAFLYYRLNGTENITSGNASLIFTEEGVHTVEYYSVDNAGNSELMKNAVVKLDMTPPSTTDDADGLWHNSTVKVSYSAIDNGSGVNKTYYKVTPLTMSLVESLFSWLGGIFGFAEGFSEGDNTTFSDEGVFTLQYFSTDNVGNTEIERISLEVKIDMTLPSIAVIAPENRTYLRSDSITLDFSSQDTLSGVKIMNASIDGTRQVSDGEVLDVSELSVGEHEFILIAEDNASNLNTQTVPFNVVGAEISGSSFINGTVTSGGLPVSGAYIVTTGANYTSGLNGNYSLSVPPGSYTVYASKQPEYYEKNITDVVVTSSNTTTVYIVITGKPTGTLSGSVKNI